MIKKNKKRNHNSSYDYIFNYTITCKRNESARMTDVARVKMVMTNQIRMYAGNLWMIPTIIRGSKETPPRETMMIMSTT
jgi:hypothetical protein